MFRLGPLTLHLVSPCFGSQGLTMLTIVCTRTHLRVIKTWSKRCKDDVRKTQACPQTSPVRCLVLFRSPTPGATKHWLTPPRPAGNPPETAGKPRETRTLSRFLLPSSNSVLAVSVKLRARGPVLAVAWRAAPDLGTFLDRSWKVRTAPGAGRTQGGTDDGDQRL